MSRRLVMRFFRPEIELIFKALGVFILLGLIVLPVAWGYEQRRLAREWQKIACAYRMREVTRRTPFIAAVDANGDACGMLQRLGFTVDDRR